MFISKRYVPIGKWNNMRVHILNTISHYFLFEFNLSNLLCLRSFLPLEEENYTFSPISTWIYLLQLFYGYHSFAIATHHFTMEKWNFIGMVTLNTLETMIEYTLISSI
jgi:hypothetical protein